MTTPRFVNGDQHHLCVIILSPTSDEGQPLIAGFYCVLPLETVQVGFAEQPKVGLWIYEKFY